MTRFAGQPLPPKPRIALISNDAIGNFVVVTPLLQMLRERHSPERLEYFCGNRVRELLDASDLFDSWLPVHGAGPETTLPNLPREPFDLVVNVEQTPVSKVAAAWLAGGSGFVCGPCSGEEGRGELPFGEDARGRLWGDRRWIAEDLTDRYPFLTTSWIGEIFCRLAYLDGPVAAYKVPVSSPGRSIPDVLIACAASSEDKLWAEGSWLAVCKALTAGGVTVGLLGAPPRDQGRYWRGASVEDRLVEEAGVEDLRGAFPLPGVAGALAQARAVLTLDNGIMHLAAAVAAPTVALFRHGIHRLWAPPAPALSVLTPADGRGVAEVGIDDVRSAIASILDAP